MTARKQFGLELPTVRTSMAVVFHLNQASLLSIQLHPGGVAAYGLEQAAISTKMVTAHAKLAIVAPPSVAQARVTRPPPSQSLALETSIFTILAL
jgi:hypothetical protein